MKKILVMLLVLFSVFLSGCTYNEKTGLILYDVDDTCNNDSGGMVVCQCSDEKLQKCNTELGDAKRVLQYTRDELKIYKEMNYNMYVPEYVDVLQEFRKYHQYSYPDYICGDMVDDFRPIMHSRGYATKKRLVVVKNCNQFEDEFKCRHYIVEIVGGIYLDPVMYDFEIGAGEFDEYYSWD